MKPSNRRSVTKSGLNRARSAELGAEGDYRSKAGRSGRRNLPNLTELSGRYRALVVSLFSLITLFSLMDLATSFEAYRQGLAEGNLMLLGSSQVMGVSVFNALAGSKMVFVLGIGGVAMMGAWSRNSTVRKMILAMLGTFVVVFALVSLNNLVALGVF